MPEQCERGEDTAMRAYGAGLEKDLPAEVGVIVRRRYAGVKKNHSRIRALRSGLQVGGAAQKLKGDAQATVGWANDAVKKIIDQA